jgi:hypothetical protein
MLGSWQCLKALKVPKQVVGAKPLLKKLLLQMDNCVKDNKNDTCLFFLSLLTMKEVFEEVQLGFLVVGHMYEDIFGNFGYLSKKLKEQNKICVREFYESIYGLITRMTIHSPTDSKNLGFQILGSRIFENELEVLVGHTNMHLFQIFVDSSRWLVMQYKVFPIDSI